MASKAAMRVFIGSTFFDGKRIARVPKEKPFEADWRPSKQFYPNLTLVFLNGAESILFMC